MRRRRRTGEEERRGEEEEGDSAEVNHKTTHRGSGKRIWGKCPKANISFEGVFKGPGPRVHGSMREPLEMVKASLMQNMVQICKKKHLFRDQITF